MRIKEAIDLLLQNGFLVEDTDEYDNADLGINVDPKDYHRQKAKMHSLEDRLKDILNIQYQRQIDTIQKKIPTIQKVLSDLDKAHKKLFPYDDYGSYFLKTDVETKTLKGDTRRKLIKIYDKGLEYGHGRCCTKDEIDRLRKVFITKWLPNAMALLNKETITVYRGMRFRKKDITKDTMTLIKMNLLDRNSWTYNRAVAEEFATCVGSMDIQLIVSMECSIDEVNLAYSAWQEGFYGDTARSAYGANDEINLKQSFIVNNVNIEILKGKL